jgi:hypothetical protein
MRDESGRPSHTVDSLAPPANERRVGEQAEGKAHDQRESEKE